MLKEMIQSLLPTRIVVVRSSAHAAKIADAIRKIPPLDSDISVALDSVRADVSRMTDAYHSVRADDPSYSVGADVSRMTGPSPYAPYATVAAHFASASSKPSKLALLAQVVRLSNAQSILEIGTAYGLSAIAMAKAQTRPNLLTIDLYEPQISISRRHLAARFPGGGVEQIVGDKAEVIPRLVQEGRKFDLVFHDGGHDGDAYVQDFAATLPALSPASLFLIDDIRWDDAPERRLSRTAHKSVRTCYEGWCELTRHSSVQGAIEIQKSLGLLMFS